MWQFMPATGKSFDLKQNAFRDDRRDVLASTRAALDYLQRLHNMFGDWHLALAAYNWGEGNVGKALARNQRSQLGLSYTDLNMPNETRYYVPKLQAVKNIVAMPHLYTLQLPHIPNHPYFQTVPLTRDIDVTLAAQLADISVEDFKSLNPSAHRPVLLAAGTPQLLLPWDNAEIFMRNFAQHGEARMASWTAWVTPNSIKVAEAAKRAGMPEADFRALNGIPPHMLIKSGSALLVPRTARMEDDVSPAIADAPQRWVPSGDITALTDGRNVVRIGYGLELRPIPFSLKLVNFEVPRYEGTETPANFISTLEFKDNATGEVKAGTARMNHPASFPGTLFANFTGINYKFSQAEWNPQDLGETTLQVLYDPGWILKWTGSLAICIGITIMFYFKPKTGNA
jgi:membrane-bound lytic murein transglycosylase D